MSLDPGIFSYNIDIKLFSDYNEISDGFFNYGPKLVNM